ncbi:Ecd, partial [Symbiodinium pilosum]
ALRRLRGEGSPARGKMQQAIEARLEGYPKRAYELSKHVVRAVLPERVARLLIAFPQLIAVVLDHLPTPPSRELLRFRRDLPDELSKLHLDCDACPDEATVCVGVRFTRLQYARLKSLRCQLPQRFGRQKWRAPKGMETSVSEKAMQLGAMLCAGLEAAYLQGPRSATATLQWTRLPKAQADCPWRSDPTIRKHLQHEGSLAGVAAARAYSQQHNLDDPFREAFLRIYEDQELLAAVDLETHWRDRDDLEEWLQVTPEDLDREMKVRQEEFDRFDQKRAASQKSAPKEPSQGASAEELQAEIAQMGSKISDLLQGTSSVDGVEGAQKSGATVSTDADSVDSDSGSDEPLDVLGMEEEFEEASEEEEEAGQDGKDESGRMEEYFSELDEQLESALDGETAGQEATDKNDALPLSSRHIKVHASDPLELDMHAMEHVLASFCSEHQLEPGPASVLLHELGLAGGGRAEELDSLD